MDGTKSDLHTLWTEQSLSINSSVFGRRIETELAACSDLRSSVYLYSLYRYTLKLSIELYRRFSDLHRTGTKRVKDFSDWTMRGLVT